MQSNHKSLTLILWLCFWMELQWNSFALYPINEKKKKKKELNVLIKLFTWHSRNNYRLPWPEVEYLQTYISFCLVGLFAWYFCWKPYNLKWIFHMLAVTFVNKLHKLQILSFNRITNYVALAKFIFIITHTIIQHGTWNILICNRWTMNTYPIPLALFIIACG